MDPGTGPTDGETKSGEVPFWAAKNKLLGGSTKMAMGIQEEQVIPECSYNMLFNNTFWFPFSVQMEADRLRSILTRWPMPQPPLRQFCPRNIKS
jgi:hypothetical protein